MIDLKGLRAHFESVDRRSNQIRGRNDEEGLVNYTAEICRVLPDEPKSLVLELGCADGVVTNRVARERPDLRIIGGDLSMSLLIHARAAGLKVVQLAAPHFPFRHESIDAVVSFSFLQYFDVRGYESMMHELQFVLRPNGIVAHLSVPDLAHFWVHSQFPKSVFSKRSLWVFQARMLRRFGVRADRSYWWSRRLIERHTPKSFSVKCLQSKESWHRMDVIARKVSN